MVGTQSNGQGHETVPYAQFLSEPDGHSGELIHVNFRADSDLIKQGGGLAARALSQRKARRRWPQWPR